MWMGDGIKGSNKGREVLVLPSRKGNQAFWSDHCKAFVVTCSGDGEKRAKLYCIIEYYRIL
jgi:hypothetical protein